MTSVLDKFAKISTKKNYNTRLSAKEYKCFCVKFSGTEKIF